MSAEPIRPRGSAATRLSTKLREFLEDNGPTPACAGCKRSRIRAGLPTPGSMRHSTACRARREDWRAMKRVTEPMLEEEQRQRSRRRSEEQPGMSVRRGLPGSEVGMSVRQSLPEPDPSGIADKTPPLSVTKPLGRAFLANEPGVIPAEILTDRGEVQLEGGGGESSGEPTDISMEEMDRAIERGQKRDREEEEGEADDEEYSARVVKRLLGVVSQNGPPWYDANGMPLDNEKVKAGMDKESASLQSFPTYIEVDDTEPAKHGKKVIRSGWVLSDRGETVKARLVAQEVNYGDYMDAFAATPMSASLRVLLKIAMQRGWPVRLADLSTAFLYARLGEGELVYVLPPQSERKEGQGVATAPVLVWTSSKSAALPGALCHGAEGGGLSTTTF